MKKIHFLLGFALAFAVPAMIFAASFQVYPGAKLVDVHKMTEPAAPGQGIPGKESKSSKEIVFTTNDPFENVVAFYRGLAREYRMPGAVGGKSSRLSSGQELREAYFIFDNAADLSTSQHWVKIQRPYLGKGQASDRLGASRDLTGIIEEDRRSYP